MQKQVTMQLLLLVITGVEEALLKSKYYPSLTPSQPYTINQGGLLTSLVIVSNCGPIVKNTVVTAKWEFVSPAMISTTRTPSNPPWEINAIFMSFALHTSCPSFMCALIWNCMWQLIDLPHLYQRHCGSLKSLRATWIPQRAPICRHARMMREEW